MSMLTWSYLDEKMHILVLSLSDSEETKKFTLSISEINELMIEATSITPKNMFYADLDPIEVKLYNPQNQLEQMIKNCSLSDADKEYLFK